MKNSEDPISDSGFEEPLESCMAPLGVEISGAAGEAIFAKANGSFSRLYLTSVIQLIR
jgi:hypothetical protein